MIFEQEFFTFVMERDLIRLKKELHEPKPWTQDETLQDYKFCNVFRELDATTIWIKENIRDRWANHQLLWFALAVARRINYAPSLRMLDNLLVEWDPSSAMLMLEELRTHNMQIYGSAYTLTTSSKKMSKNEYSVYECLDKLWDRRLEISTALDWSSNTLTLGNAFDLFRKGNPGISNFLAYEIVTDMRHTRYLNNAKDIMTWANAGPGAIRGLNRIKGDDIHVKIKPCQANMDMQYLLSQAEYYLPDGFPAMEMRDIEHSLCEYDKYMRIRTGKGFLCRKYNGRG